MHRLGSLFIIVAVCNNGYCGQLFAVLLRPASAPFCRLSSRRWRLLRSLLLLRSLRLLRLVSGRAPYCSAALLIAAYCGLLQGAGGHLFLVSTDDGTVTCHLLRLIAASYCGLLQGAGGHLFLVSTDDGTVTCHDARRAGAAPVFTIGAHAEVTPAPACCGHCGLLRSLRPVAACCAAPVFTIGAYAEVTPAPACCGHCGALRSLRGVAACRAAPVFTIGAHAEARARAGLLRSLRLVAVVAGRSGHCGELRLVAPRPSAQSVPTPRRAPAHNRGLLRSLLVVSVIAELCGLSRRARPCHRPPRARTCAIEVQ